jgi:hypothetical protein
MRVAQTKQAELEAQGYKVLIRRASSFDDFNRELTSNGTLVGVEYVGHSSKIFLYVGDWHGEGSNVHHSNVTPLSNANLSPDAYIKLNGCNVAAGRDNSIAQWISNWLGRTVIAFDGPSRFYWLGGGSQPPPTGPMWLAGEKGTNTVYLTPH